MKLTEINKKYPEHSRTSCSDEVLYNRGWNEGGNLYCPRCQALYELKIQVDAGRAGFVAGYSEAQSAPFTANDTEIDLYADEYAERILRGDL